MSTTTKGTALITGASAGIGAIYADRLAKRGYDLILAARDKTRLAALAQRLRNSTGCAVDTVAADLNDKTDLARVEAILRANANITLLVNNAGVGATAPLLNADIQKMDDMIGLNVGALTRLTYAAAPGFVARGIGTIINISSIVAISGNAQWRLRWQQGLRAGLLAIAASRTRSEGRARPGRAPRCHRDRFLGRRRRAAPSSAGRDCDVRR